VTPEPTDIDVDHLLTTTRAVRKRLVLDRPDHLATERRIAERRTSAEGQEGLRAFIEKRQPAWRSESSS